nr:AzlC family ABC transporter permease [Halomicroarcula sp. SYNS111]
MTARDDFVAGVRTMAPVLPGILPFTLIFGVVAVSVGITPLQAVAMSVVLFAGTSQLAAIELIGQHAPAAVVVLTVVVINLRVVMYSASMAPYFSDLGVRWRGVLSYLLTDHVYALAITEAEVTDGSVSLRWYFLGLGTAIWVAFQAGTVAGRPRSDCPGPVGPRVHHPAHLPRNPGSRDERADERGGRRRCGGGRRRRCGAPGEPRPLCRRRRRRAPGGRAERGERRVTPSSDWLIWMVVVVGGLATFALRASFIFLFEQLGDLLARLEPVLDYVPAAVLAALVAPSFVALDGPATVGLASEQLLAGVGAFVVAWVTENMLATIVAGMAIFWAVRFVA